MDAVGGVKDVPHLIFRQQLRQVPGAAEQRILLPAADPQGLDLLVGALGVLQQGGEARFKIGGYRA